MIKVKHTVSLDQNLNVKQIGSIYSCFKILTKLRGENHSKCNSGETTIQNAKHNQTLRIYRGSSMSVYVILNL